ncbi:MAG: 50S ribosomal protein L22, partial [Thermoprotei archaeon]
MAKNGYSIENYDPTTMALAAGRDLRVSFKKTMNVCRAIKGMRLDQAKAFLNGVIQEKVPVTFTKYRKKVGHKRALGGVNGAAGRYPVLSAKAVLKVLENAENNASKKGLDPSRLIVYHAAAQKAGFIPRIYPRAFGRMDIKHRILTHVEI